MTDLVEKAEAMQIKVWTVKSESASERFSGQGLTNAPELGEMLSRLAPLATASNNSLSHLLEDERLHGTRERDLSAPRPDYYYFKPGSKYLLVEDATAKSRTIMVKEYHYHSGNIEWPVIFSSFLKPHSGMMNTAVPVDKLRERAWALYVDREEYDGEQPPADQIKRSTSLRSLPETARLPTLQPYENASGNSVVLTSNIASTSAANGTPNGQPMGPSLGMTKDRALMQMSKRVQVLKGNARLAAMSRKKEQENSDPLRSGGLARRASTGTVGGKLEGLSTKTFVPQDQLIRMLRLARDPCADEVTYEERVKNREKVDLGLKGRDQDTASGYCENCRLRYQDLSVVSVIPLAPPGSLCFRSDNLFLSTSLQRSTADSPKTTTTSKDWITCSRHYNDRPDRFVKDSTHLAPPIMNRTLTVESAIQLSIQIHRSIGWMMMGCTIPKAKDRDPKWTMRDVMVMRSWLRKTIVIQKARINMRM